MNITKLIKKDRILSFYDFDMVYIILLRLKHLGYLCECKSKNNDEE